jgi:hypothetical protein
MPVSCRWCKQIAKFLSAPNARRACRYPCSCSALAHHPAVMTRDCKLVVYNTTESVCFFLGATRQNSRLRCRQPLAPVLDASLLEMFASDNICKRLDADKVGHGRATRVVSASTHASNKAVASPFSTRPCSDDGLSLQTNYCTRALLQSYAFQLHDARVYKVYCAHALVTALKARLERNLVRSQRSMG